MPARSEDGALVDAFRAGETHAFDAIVHRHYAAMLRVAEQRCGGGALAEDAVQTGLIRAHRYLQGRGPVENLGAWLRRIVFNCATDLIAAASRGGASLVAAAEVAAPPDPRVERQELTALIEAAIVTLPWIYREPLTLHYLHGLESREVAARLGENLNSIKSRISRGRHELRRLLEGRLTRSGYL